MLQVLEGHIGSLSGKDILELGPNEGEVIYLLESFAPRSIISIECRAINFFKCLTVKNHYALNRSTFLLGDFQQYLEAADRHFDTVLAIGVLYHKTNPLGLLSAIAKNTSILL